MGRPPIGKVAMTSTERVHRFRAKRRTGKPETKHETKPGLDTLLMFAKLKARIAELERQLTQAHKRIAGLERRGAGEGQLTRSHREERSRPVEFTEVGRLRAEIGRLKSDNIKLKMMLQEEPDAAKLRKKVVDLQVEKANLRQELRRVAKERDKYQVRLKPKYREAMKLLTRKTHDAIIWALHADRLKQCSSTELATAHTLVTALRPLFDEG
jgi:hypothetical protein